MEIRTKRTDEASWTEWPDLAHGLLSLLESDDVQVMLFTEDPEIERDLVAAALRLTRAVAREGTDVIVASPHPSAEWIRSLRALSPAAVWALTRHGNGELAPIEVSTDVARGVCPELHSRTNGHTTASVCGRCGDRLVLGSRHLERWCLGDPSRCPRWKDGGLRA